MSYTGLEIGMGAPALLAFESEKDLGKKRSASDCIVIGFSLYFKSTRTHHAIVSKEHAASIRFDGVGASNSLGYVKVLLPQLIKGET